MTDASSGQLEVAVRCEGGTVSAFIANEMAVAHLVSAQDEQGGELPRNGNRFSVPEAASTIRYQINLDATAYETADIDVTYKAGGGWVSAGSTWLLQPEPLRRDSRITVAVTTPAGSNFATGMKRDAQGHYTMGARRIHSATYGVFGDFHQSSIEVPGPFALARKAPALSQPTTSRIQLVVMPGQLSLDHDQLRTWLRDAATAVGQFWGGFPVEEVCVVVVPSAGYDKVVHGKVVSAGGPTIALRVGAEMDPARVHDDWIVVHEFFHLGFPTFPHSGKWLDEGLATYYEPIIRTRAGWRSEEDLWQELAYDMPQGLPAMERRGLENASDFQDVYWGGAMFAFVADLRIREQSGNRLSLEDGLRAVLAKGGHAGTIWTVDKAVKVVDEALGMQVVGNLLTKHRKQGHPVHFPKLLGQLGVSRSADGVSLDDGAAWAPTRRLMMLQAPTAPNR